MVTPSAELADQYGALSAADVAALDGAAEEGGITVAQLMETAGFQVARCTHQLAVERNAARIIVIAGSGNNGGDGLVAARHLLCWGWPVEVSVVADPGRWELAALTVPIAALGARVSVDGTGTTALATLRDSADAVVVDALLGTGLVTPPRPVQAAVIRAMAGAVVLSVDIPSGMDATTGATLLPTVLATRTCTLAAVKKGLWQESAREYAGDIWVADISIPSNAWLQAGHTRPQLVRGGELLPLPTDT